MYRDVYGLMRCDAFGSPMQDCDMKDSSRQNAKPTKGTKVTRSRKQAVVRKPSEEQIRKITRTVVEMNRETLLELERH